MPNPLFRPPRHLVKEWPEVFEDLYMNTMPVAYLETIHLEFANGRVWQLNIKEQLMNTEPDSVADKLISVLKEYQEDVIKIDFKVDIRKLKEDIKNETKNIF